VKQDSKKNSWKRIRLTAILLFIISLILFFFSFKNLLIMFGLFLFCLLFMFKFGQFIFLDLDPVPFSAILLLYFYDYKLAIHFVLLALPSIDLLSSRLNHFSIINFISIIITLLLFSFLPLKGMSLYFAILIFNVIRSIINQFFGLGLQTLMFNMAHACIYFVLGSLIGFFT